MVHSNLFPKPYATHQLSKPPISRYYFHPASGISQWQHPGTAQFSASPLPPQAPPAQQSGGWLGKLTHMNPTAQTALTVGGGLAAGALLEHEVSEFSHHHHIHGPGLGTMASLLGAAGAGALGAKMFGSKQQGQPPPSQQMPGYPPQAAYPPSAPPAPAYPAAVPVA